MDRSKRVNISQYERVITQPLALLLFPDMDSSKRVNLHNHEEVDRKENKREPYADYALL